MSITVARDTAFVDGCTNPATWHSKALDMARTIEQRFDVDDRISLAIRWHPGDSHMLYLSLVARGQQHYLMCDLSDWQLMHRHSRTPAIHDGALADAIEGFIVGAMFRTRGPTP